MLKLVKGNSVAPEGETELEIKNSVSPDGIKPEFRTLDTRLIASFCCYNCGYSFTAPISNKNCPRCHRDNLTQSEARMDKSKRV